MAGGDAIETEEHKLPSRPSAELGRPALVVAFPRSVALPLPDAKTPLGREHLARAAIVDTEVSGRHLSITRAGPAFQLEDVGSRNGTWVDGRRVLPGDRVALSDGAVIRIGRTLLVFRERLEGPAAPSPPLGRLVAPFGMRAVAATIEAWKRRPPRNVLIEGDTGTGKELAAAAVATALGRSEPYAPVNVAGVAAGVFESQLFGHVAGAFSDAKRASRGIVLAHDRGTVFLDELGELPLELQPKLLRLLENREVLAVGAERPVLVDVLVVAATNRALAQMVAEGRFRADLLARFATAKLELPSLADRAEDVFAIAQAIAAAYGDPLRPEDVEVEALERLLLDRWPENVRGLAAAMARVTALDPAPGLRLWSVERVLGPPADKPKDHLSRELVDAALAATGGNETRAAARLGVTRGKLRRFLAGRAE
jgi:transcriptional regulator of acetoin/glycerol metabolism